MDPRWTFKRMCVWFLPIRCTHTHTNTLWEVFFFFLIFRLNWYDDLQIVNFLLRAFHLPTVIDTTVYRGKGRVVLALE